MPQLAVSNRVQAAYKLEGAYPTNFGTLAGGNGTLVNFTGESFDYSIKYEQSAAIRADRQVGSHIAVDANSSGGLSIEHIYADYDRFLESILGSGANLPYGTLGVGAVFTTTALAAGIITATAATTGSSLFTTLRQGQWFRIIPAVGETAAVQAYFNSRAFKVHATTAPTSTVITLDPATPIAAPGLGVALVGAAVSSSYFANGVTTPNSYTIEIGHTDINQYRQYTGQIPGKMSFKLSSASKVTGSIDFMGKSMTVPLPVTTGMGTVNAASTSQPANATKGIFEIYEGGVPLSATTYLKSGDFTIDGSLRFQEAAGVFGAAGIGQGTFKVTGSLEVYFADATVYGKFLADTRAAITIPILDGAGNGYIYHFPRVAYTAAKVNVGGIDQDAMLSMSFEAEVDTVSTSPTFNKTVVIYRVGAAAA